MDTSMTHFLAQFPEATFCQLWVLTDEVTASELAEQEQLSADQWAAFNLADWPGCEHWLQSFDLLTSVDGTAVAFNLDKAKVAATNIAQMESAQSARESSAEFSGEQLMAQMLRPAEGRDARAQASIDALNAETDRLTTQLDAIAAVTTVDELNVAMGYPRPTT